MIAGLFPTAHLACDAARTRLAKAPLNHAPQRNPTLQTAPIPRRAALYARVSTRNGQSPENQIQALCDVASRKGWEIVDQYVDNGVSGAKGRDRRPEFDRLLKDATAANSMS